MTNEQDKEPLTRQRLDDSSPAQSSAITLENAPASADVPMAPATEPERSDENPLVNLRQTVVALLPIATLATAAILWSCFGKIPIEVAGRAVLMAPRSNLEFQSPGSGTVSTILVKPGEQVKAGQLLATLKTSELNAELESKQQKLAQLQTENTAITAIQNQRTRLKQDVLQSQQQSVPDQARSIQAQIAANQQQQQVYVQRIEQLNAINTLIADRLKAYNKLRVEGAVAPLDVTLVQIVQAEQTNKNEVTSLKAKIEELNAQIRALQSKAIDLKAQTANLANQSSQITLDDLEANTQRRNAITDLERDIADLRVKIRTESRVVSPREGQVIDIAVNPGQVIGSGTILGTIQVDRSNNQTSGLAFFTVGAADRIAPGMAMELTPDSYSRQRFGSIVAEVISVAPATVTPQQISSIVGNDQLAKGLLVENPSVLVTAKLHLDPNTPSGYQWTRGEGPPQKIPESATATATVTVEERSLLSYMTPALRQLTGIY